MFVWMESTKSIRSAGQANRRTEVSGQENESKNSREWVGERVGEWVGERAEVRANEWKNEIILLSLVSMTGHEIYTGEWR